MAKNIPEVAIKVEDVYKSFKIPHEKNRSLKSAAINIFKSKNYTVHDAAKGISFEVRAGEFLGIIGRNGCGKSTMLKMLAGIYIPNKGKITVNGRLSPFLELGVGFNPELTARDNVYLNGTMLGLSRKEIDEKFDEIIEFAELQEFVDQKLKNFSSGMQVRLAFSVAVQAHAEILLIDEVLAVGDTNFQRKCYSVFENLKSNGKTIVFVSHNMDVVKRFCDRVILINDAEIEYEGKPEKATAEYDKLNLATGWTDNNESAEVRVQDIEIKDLKSKKTSLVKPENDFEINFKCVNLTDKEKLVNISVEIQRYGFQCFGTRSSNQIQKNMIAPGKTGFLKLKITNNQLLPGEYNITYRLFSDDFQNYYEIKVAAASFIIEGEAGNKGGVVNLGDQWTN